MHEAPENRRDLSLVDTIERLRAERFPLLDRSLVQKILSLHAEVGSNDGISRQIDQAIAEQLGENL